MQSARAYTMATGVARATSAPVNGAVRRARATVCQADKRQAGEGSSSMRELQVADVPLLTLAASAPSVAFAQALADGEVATRGPGDFGLSVNETLLLLSPVLLYSVFTIYRTAINPAVKISDFAFGMATFVLFANIFSILVFKVRFF